MTTPNRTWLRGITLLTALVVVPGSRHSAPMPHLRRVPFTHGLDTLFWESVPGIAVSRNGRVAVASDIAIGKKEGYILQILSPTADTLISVARHGEGPGELSGSDIPFASGDTFHIFNMRRRVDVTYSEAGKYLGERRLEASLSDMVLGFSGDSVDLQPLQIDPRVPVAGPSRRKIGEPTGRLLFLPTDSFIHREQTLAPGQGAKVLPYASNNSMLAAGNGLAYRIAVYSASGKFLYILHRDLPPNHRSATETAALRKSLNATLLDPRGSGGLSGELHARLDTLERETVARFTWTGMHFDGAGRLWVVGQVGDSTFADAFSGQAFLGRQVLPCTRPGRRIALLGKWLALDCEAASNGAAPFQIQLYAIEN